MQVRRAAPRCPGPRGRAARIDVASWRASTSRTDRVRSQVAPRQPRSGWTLPFAQEYGAARLTILRRVRFPGHILPVCLLVAIAAMLPAVWSSHWGLRQRARVHLARARSQITGRQLEQARKELRAALLLDPAELDARRQLAG